jgi:hypothetical protein
MTAFQASARGGWLDCELSEDRVYLVGNAVTFMEATIFLPDDASAPATALPAAIASVQQDA